MEHQTLGSRFVCPIGSATQREFILDWRILDLGMTPQTHWDFHNQLLNVHPQKIIWNRAPDLIQQFITHSIERSRLSIQSQINSWLEVGKYLKYCYMHTSILQILVMNPFRSLVSVSCFAWQEPIVLLPKASEGQTQYIH